VEVLITEGASGGQSRAAVAAVRALAIRGYRPVVAVSGDHSLAAASRFCSRTLRVPPVDDTRYGARIRAELATGRYVTVFAASDPALLALGLPVDRFVNKIDCLKVIAAAGLAAPPSRTFASRQELLAAAQDLSFPAVVKPAIKSHLATLVPSPKALPSMVRVDGPVVVQPYVDQELRGVLGLVWRGELKAAVHLRYLRLWPLPCGTVAAGESVEPDSALEARLPDLFDGYDGLFHMDLAGPYVLDVNPRVHAALPLAVAAGANLVSMYCDLLRGRSIRPVRGRNGLFYRWIEGDVRSVMRSMREGRFGAGAAFGALAPRHGAVHSYESLRDPGPTLARARYLAGRLRMKLPVDPARSSGI
jgi:hypothetical protein